MVKGGSAWGKNCRREILHTLGRFLAILAIVALGVGFFCGLRLARPAMAKTGDDYLRKTNFYDYQLLSTVGFTDEDVAYFAAMDGVTQAEGSVSEDLLTTWKGEPLVFKTHALLQEINQVVLTAGRMPEKANEVLGDDYFFTEDDLGKTLTVDNEDESAFSQDSYVLVGLCNSPQYLNVQRGTSSLGNGTVSGFLFLTEAGYDTDYFTELYLTVDNDDDAFSEAYAAAMDAWETPLSDAVELRGQSRRDTLIEDAQAELRDGWAEYDDGLQEYEDSRADTDQELADAKQELDDALKELNDGEADYAEGVETLSALREDPLSNDELRDARQELDDGWQKYYDGLQEYEDGLATYEEEVAENQPKLDDAKVELQDALKQIREGEAEYNEGKATLQALAKDPTSNAELAAARNELDSNWALYEEGVAEFEAQKAAAEALRAADPESEGPLEALGVGHAQNAVVLGGDERDLLAPPIEDLALPMRNEDPLGPKTVEELPSVRRLGADHVQTGHAGVGRVVDSPQLPASPILGGRSIAEGGSDHRVHAVGRRDDPEDGSLREIQLST